MLKDCKVVGKYKTRFNKLTGQSIKCGKIYQSAGLISHIEHHHPDCLDTIQYLGTIIDNPDYVGKNPKYNNSIELVKIIDGNIMVCVKLDSENEYLYVSTIFRINDSKLNNRIHSGRLKKY